MCSYMQTDDGGIDNTDFVFSLEVAVDFTFWKYIELLTYVKKKYLW